MEFGGQWTEVKLGILENYLDAYTTALKKQSFNLMYIDAFAGTGQITSSSDTGRTGFYGLLQNHLINIDDDTAEDLHNFTSGSVERAIKTDNKPFDRLVFVEKDTGRCEELEKIKNDHLERKIEIANSDANEFLLNLHEDWKKWRGVLFLDPFATEVKWETIEIISDFNALDTWILFPTHAVVRMLSKKRMPEGALADRLTEIYGDDSWRDLYSEKQSSLFGDPQLERKAGSKRLVEIYKENLKQLFDDRFLQESKLLMNSKNVPLFEFIFCAGHSRGAKIAKKIAGHLIKPL